ncbi:MAG: phosphoribosylaminoimidazolesuccinocarboxamide synthase [Actinobacteria bacterium]|nr:phosphoribosylaminoimidazolesuccinocarboxamide synthase [Actinomycetota bacterium]
MSTAMFESTERGLPLFRRGKVRDIYRPSAEHLIIVACDRISAFDHVLPTPIPDKGRILTQISNFWFKHSGHIIPNHIVDPDPGPQWYPELDWYNPELDGRTVLVRSTTPLVIEAIVRGYLSGTGWKEYRASGTVCELPLPTGLKESDRLPEPIFTPSTKAVSGHDENISFERAASLVGTELAEKVREASLALYRFAAEHALKRGIIIADTKFEFGTLENGELILIDEILTPDSSRFWPADSYESGRAQASFDKQYVRDYLESIEWDKEPPAPVLPDEVVEKTREKYWEAATRLTGGDD